VACLACNLARLTDNGLLLPQQASSRSLRAACFFGTLFAVACLDAAHAYGENGHGRWTAEAQEEAEREPVLSGLETKPDPPPGPPKPLPTCGESHTGSSMRTAMLPCTPVECPVAAQPGF